MNKEMKERPLILVSNDDSIHAPGVLRLLDVLTKFADVVCVCPDAPRSGQSMAITIAQPLRAVRVADYRGAKMYKVNGTPVDCVKLAMHAVLERKPDMVVSGINHGSNSSINELYSGTMGAAKEGCVFGIPSIGFSLTDHSMDADFGPCMPFVEEIVRKVMDEGLPEGVCLNVNIPDSQPGPTEYRVVRSARAKWTDEYQEYTDPFGGKFYMLTGEFINEEPDAEDTDEWCLAHGIVSVVEVRLW